MRYLDYYNTDPAHTGRWTRGRTPESVIGKAKAMVVTHSPMCRQIPVRGHSRGSVRVTWTGECQH